MALLKSTTETRIFRVRLVKEATIEFDQSERPTDAEIIAEADEAGEICSMTIDEL